MGGKFGVGPSKPHLEMQLRTYSVPQPIVFGVPYCPVYTPSRTLCLSARLHALRSTVCARYDLQHFLGHLDRHGGIFPVPGGRGACRTGLIVGHFPSSLPRQPNKKGLSLDKFLGDEPGSQPRPQSMIPFVRTRSGGSVLNTIRRSARQAIYAVWPPFGLSTQPMTA